MSRNNRPLRRTWKNVIAQVLTVVVGTFIIVWFLPRSEHDTMLVDVGRPWPYSRLIAAFDFPVLKTEEQLQREQDSIQRAYEPFFELQTWVETEQVDAFRTAFRTQSQDLSLAYRVIIEKRMREIYRRGIINASDLQVLKLQNTAAVTIYHGNEAVVTPIGQLLTEKAAYEYMFARTDSLANISRQRLQRLDLNQYIRPNLAYDEVRSQQLWDEMERSLSPSSGMFLAGQNIIDRGDIVDANTYLILRSYQRAAAERNQKVQSGDLSLLGQVLYVVIILACLVMYFNLFRRDYISSVRGVLLLAMLVMAFPLITSALVRHTLLSVYIVPYAMLSIFIRVFMDSRTAFFAHVCTLLLSALSLRYPFEFIVTQSVAGLVSIYSMRELSERSQLIRTAFIVTLASLLTYMSLDLIHGRSFLGRDSITNVDYDIYVHLLISGVMLLFAYPFMAMLERIFGFISNVTLVELSNINRDPLRRLSEAAPGTFQHSMQVANLAAEVANRIGAKAQLVRTGALYHDIGKTLHPEYFTENQLGGVNPHALLTNRESAAIILRHVTDGESLADRARLPRIIRDFISTHHGRGVAKYFYINEKNANPDVSVDAADFTYKGPNPTTAEQGILMMADAVEATARSLKEYSEKTIGDMVDRIVDAQMAEGYFADCPLTFRDIRQAKEVLKSKLMTIYHTRLSYPTLKAVEPEKADVAQSGSTSK